MRQTLVQVRNRVLDSVYWPQSRREFLACLSTVHNADDAVSLVFKQYKGFGYYKWLRPNQDEAELRRLVQRVESIQPKVVVEIGTRSGGTLFVWSQCSPRLELLVSIDLPGGPFGGGYVEQRRKLFRLFTTNHSTTRLELLAMDSHAAETRRRLVELLDGRAIDFLLLDGDRSYEGTKRDFADYGSLVRQGGFIAFKDIRPNAKNPTIQMFRAWDEIKPQAKEAEEIVTQPYSGRYGIGLFVK